MSPHYTPRSSSAETETQRVENGGRGEDEVLIDAGDWPPNRKMAGMRSVAECGVAMPSPPGRRHAYPLPRQSMPPTVDTLLGVCILVAAHFDSNRRRQYRNPSDIADYE
jgi:hypothetical protein